MSDNLLELKRILNNDTLYEKLVNRPRDLTKEEYYQIEKKVPVKLFREIVLQDKTKNLVILHLSKPHSYLIQ